MIFEFDLGVIGGCGHVGLPLALSFADLDQKVLIYDLNKKALEQIKSGKMPFQEEGAQGVLESALGKSKLYFSDDPSPLGKCKFLILIIGTPVDEHLNPSFATIQNAIDQCLPFLVDGQILVLRSTIYPGISSHIQNYLFRKNKNIHVAFCPERVAEGFSLKEFKELPQIVSAFDKETLNLVSDLFKLQAPELIILDPMEAELCKLMTNAWRYVQFATVNQFYMIASRNGLDFSRILHGCRHNYPRMRGMPGPGLAAGPCLVKDTMQLAAFSQNQFMLGHAAMLVNEGLPAHLIELAKRKLSLGTATAGILGMTFKGGSDDPRDSLSFKLRKLLLLECKKVVCHDPYFKGTVISPLEEVLAESDIVFVATPHRQYKEIKMPHGRHVIDVWNIL